MLHAGLSYYVRPPVNDWVKLVFECLHVNECWVHGFNIMTDLFSIFKKFAKYAGILFGDTTVKHVYVLRVVCRHNKKCGLACLTRLQPQAAAFL